LSSVIVSLPQIVARADVQYRRRAGAGEDHSRAQPGEVCRPKPLDRAEGGGVSSQQRSDARHRQPQKHLVPEDDTQRGRQTADDPALSGGGDERQVSWTRNDEQDDEGDDERAVIGNAEHGLSRLCLPGERHSTELACDDRICLESPAPR
jgi:hypothetical protein